MNYDDLEVAAFNAWPAIEQETWQGIVLRLAQGYTKRANSANVLKLQSNDFERICEHVEALFARHKLASIFRIPSYTQSDDFDRYLHSRQYIEQDKTLVMSADLTDLMSHSQKDTANHREVSVIEKNTAQWLQAYCTVSDTALDNYEPHLAILERIKGQTRFLVLKVAGREVACLLGVIEGNKLGVFDVYTAINDRGKGYAQCLLKHLFNLASSQGASLCYLQVVADNQSAVALYNKLGFKQRYYYWYRVKKNQLFDMKGL